MEDNEANRTGVQRSRRNTLGRSEYMKFCWIMSLWIDRVFPWGRRENGSAHYWNALESAPWKLSINLVSDCKYDEYGSRGKIGFPALEIFGLRLD